MQYQCCLCFNKLEKPKRRTKPSKCLKCQKKNGSERSKRKKEGEAPKVDCCFKNIDKAIRKGRAGYVCPVCKKDVSLMWFLYYEALNNKK